MRKTWWSQGEWKAVCDSCGLFFKSSDLKLRWDGLMVCQRDWETRHPQELIRAIPDQQKLPWTRPDVTPVYWVDGTICTPEGRQGVAGYGVAGCAIAGLNLGQGDEPQFI